MSVVHFFCSSRLEWPHSTVLRPSIRELSSFFNVTRRFVLATSAVHLHTQRESAFFHVCRRCLPRSIYQTPACIIIIMLDASSSSPTPTMFQGADIAKHLTASLPTDKHFCVIAYRRCTSLALSRRSHTLIICFGAHRSTRDAVPFTHRPCYLVSDRDVLIVRAFVICGGQSFRLPGTLLFLLKQSSLSWLYKCCLCIILLRYFICLFLMFAY